MIKRVEDRLEGIEESKLIKVLVDLLEEAEELGLSCHDYLNEEGTRDELIKRHDVWKEKIDAFYERFIK